MTGKDLIIMLDKNALDKEVSIEIHRPKIPKVVSWNPKDFNIVDITVCGKELIIHMEA